MRSFVDESQIDRVRIVPVALPLRRPRLVARGRFSHVTRLVLELTSSSGATGYSVFRSTAPLQVLEDRVITGLAKVSAAQSARARDRMFPQQFRTWADYVLGAAVEVAMLDLMGRIIGVSMSDLLGGACRDAIPLSGVVFREASHSSGDWQSGADTVCQQISEATSELGLGAFKYKSGAAPIEQELRLLEKVRAEFPDIDLRVDPNGAWSVSAALWAAPRLRGLGITWLEDPVSSTAGMAALRSCVGIPLATNMCLTGIQELPPGAESPVDIVLVDIGYAGGLQRARTFWDACEAWGLGAAVHAGPCNQTSIGVATTAAFASTVSQVDAGVDYIDNFLQIDLCPAPYAVRDGFLRVPTGPGSGLDVDPEALREAAAIFRSLDSDVGKA